MLPLRIFIMLCLLQRRTPPQCLVVTCRKQGIQAQDKMTKNDYSLWDKVFTCFFPPSEPGRSVHFTQTLIMRETLQWSIVRVVSQQDLKTFPVPQFPVRALGESHAKLYTKRQPSQQWPVYSAYVMYSMLSIFAVQANNNLQFKMEWVVNHYHPDKCL